MNKPDKWVVIKIKTESDITYKVFAIWLGGYLDGDYWQLNSGITKAEIKGEYINFYGHSGSCYECKVNSYGLNGFGSRILSSFIEKADKAGSSIEIMDENTDWLNIKY